MKTQKQRVFTPKERRFIVDLLESGTSIKQTAELVGVDYHAIRNCQDRKWYQDMKKEVLAEVADAVETVRKTGEGRDLKTIDTLNRILDLNSEVEEVFESVDPLVETVLEDIEVEIIEDEVATPPPSPPLFKSVHYNGWTKNGTGSVKTKRQGWFFKKPPKIKYSGWIKEPKPPITIQDPVTWGRV